MNQNEQFEVLIIGGSYSGLAAAMALGRSLRKVLVIDEGMPCNRQTPYSHNFLTQDGHTPAEIASLGRRQVEEYSTVRFLEGRAVQGRRIVNGFEISTNSGKRFTAEKLVFAGGIKDILPNIEGFVSCWGISILHCPYCHGYEVKENITGVLGNGEAGYEFVRLISNWTTQLTLYTNGASTLSEQQSEMLKRHQINIVESDIALVQHEDGLLKYLVFTDGSKAMVNTLYTQTPFEQHCTIPADLGCSYSPQGYLQVDNLQRTTIPGIYACGDSTSPMRTVANAVSTGTTAGMMLNKEMVLGRFKEN